MPEHILSKENMDSLKAIADANLKVSEARNVLFKLEEEETTYLVGREKKAMERIQKVIDESVLLVQEARENYREIVEIGNATSDLTRSITSLVELFKNATADFEERNLEWEKQIGLQQDEIVEVRNQLKAQRSEIDNDKKSIQKEQINIENEKIKIKDQWGEISRALTRLKERRT